MKYYTTFLLIFLCCNLTAQDDAQKFRVVWYNVENLFDIQDDPRTSDEEFTPSGMRRWTPKRYRHKLQQIAKVIIAAGEWDTPALIGLCEVENDSVLTQLIRQTPLRNQHYRFCLTKGSDTRGIQNALLYQRDKFAYIGETSYPIQLTKKDKPTRDILHVWGKVITQDTLDIFLCHFPSRSGGEKETEIYRIDAARTLRHLCDSIYHCRDNPHLLLMGDFNDTPEKKSILNTLNAIPYFNEPDADTHTDKRALQLYTLFTENRKQPFPGSHKYQGEWHQLDQIIINSDLLRDSSSIRLVPESIRLFAPSFLVKKDKTHQGVRPYRTYHGYRYEGGYSDHLPLLIDFLLFPGHDKSSVELQNSGNR